MRVNHRGVTLIILLLALPGCALLGRPGSDPPPGEIVRRSAEAVAEVRSLHFRLTVANGAMPLAPGFSATSIEGDAAAPDRLQAQIMARFGSVPVELKAIGIGRRQFLTNPLTSQWQDVSGQLAIPVLLGRDRGIGALLDQVQRPELVGRVRLGGTETYHLRGRLQAAPLADLIGGLTSAEGDVLVELWIDAGDFRPRQLTTTGAILRDEPAQLERRLELSAFDRPVTIEPPL